MRPARLWGAAILAASCATAGAQSSSMYDSGAMLQLQCHVAANLGVGPDAASCLQYLLGVIHGAKLAGDQTMCVPNGMSLMELPTLVSREFRADGALARLNRPQAAIEALRRALPCKPVRM